MVGGNLSEPTVVTEQYLLNLEREAFLQLKKSERKKHFEREFSSCFQQKKVKP